MEGSFWLVQGPLLANQVCYSTLAYSTQPLSSFDKTNMAEQRGTELEESLREMCSIGDIDRVRTLVASGINVNAANKMNGWTALHWAAKRSHKNVVEFLLREGADRTLQTAHGELAASLTTDAEIREVLGGSKEEMEPTGSSVNFVPNYLKNPDFFYAKKADLHQKSENESVFSSKTAGGDQEIVLKLRIADSDDPDFIEVDLQRATLLTYKNLLDFCCKELDIQANQVKKIRKLPNTKLRNDKDITRLQPFQELEVVLLTNSGASHWSRIIWINQRITWLPFVINQNCTYQLLWETLSELVLVCSQAFRDCKRANGKIVILKLWSCNW